MSGWGRHLASQGLLAAVPDLPTWSDHARNGRFLSELRAYLCAGKPWKPRIDASRVGLMGFSPGGMAKLICDRSTAEREAVLEEHAPDHRTSNRNWGLDAGIGQHG